MKYNLSNNEHLEINGDIYVKGIGEYDGTNAGGNEVKTLKDILNSGVTEITWSGLVDLRTNSKLIPGQYYRITDYTCTTIQDGTMSAGHPFDIIVTADDENTLNEEARAIQHEGDDYFSNNNLSAWKIWYILDNDITRFDWAVLHGKYIDVTYNGSVFSARYLRTMDVDNTTYYLWYNKQFTYTYPGSEECYIGTTSMSPVSGDNYDVIDTIITTVDHQVGKIDNIKEVEDGKGVIYRMIDEFGNDVPYDFKNIQFFRKWDENKQMWSIISSGTGSLPCYTFSSGGYSFTTSFRDMSLSKANEVYSNVIKEYISDGKLTLNNNCFFGNYCQSNTFGNNCYSNTFGNNCYSNTFGNNCYSNTFGYDCYSNTFGYRCYYNTFGKDCYSNSFRNYCDYNSFGDSCNYNSFGDSCNYNSFGNDCRYIKFASDGSASTKYSFYRDNHFGDGCCYILFKGAKTGSSSVQVQNYNFSQGLKGTSDAYLTIDGVRNRAYETYISKDTDGTIKESVIAEKLDKMIEISYANLVTLRDSSKLIPGQYYRITDYTCTTTKAGTKSAGHVFDIIVTADSENTLNEVARAVKHEGDTYFANCDLNAWKIWYSLDNDTIRFEWADSTNGKGVIYRMIDEFYNDVPYDFKNIQFYRQWDESKELWSTISSDTTGVPCYTFSSKGDSSTVEFTDYSLSISNYVYLNVIKEYICRIMMVGDKLTLNNNCFFGGDCYYNTFGRGCYNNTFGSDCYHNTFGIYCVDNTFGDVCENNTFGDDCVDNTFGDYCKVNTFGNECEYNTFGNECDSNTFGNGCFSNTFGDSCYDNTFGNNCNHIKFASDILETTKYKYYRDNHFGDGCSCILFKGAETGSHSVMIQNYNFSQGLKGTSTSTSLTIDGVRNRTYVTYISKDTDGTIKESVIAEKLDKMIEISYANLVTLRDSSKLVPGQQYRITDYTCTTTTAGTKSAGHVFDIIVRADSVNKLNEEAYAINHPVPEGETDYFANNNLSAWKIWYCLDNDTTRFTWADNTNGKGVIYRMIDEFNNDVPYDFKNIQFYRLWNSSKSLWSTISPDTTGVPCYTFSSKGDSSTVEFTDMSLSLSNKVYSNVIKEYISGKKLKLSNNCFFGNNCFRNTFGNICYYNTFGNSCYSNTFGNSCYSNTFGNNCQDNIFGNYCYYNTFGINCSSNTFGNSCQSNTFGNRCGYNTFGNYCGSNTFRGSCQSNTFGNECDNTTFGEDCKYNTFGNSCYNNTFGSSTEQSQFGNGVQYFSITNTQMTTTPTSTDVKSYIRWLIVENGVNLVNAYVTGSTSNSSYCQNIRICQGCSGTSDSYKSFQIDNINMASQLIVCYDTSGTLRTGNIGNLLAKLS